MKEQNIKNVVIFDMDGVLVDSEPYHMKAERKVFKYLGIEISDELHHSFVGTSSSIMWEIIIGKFNLKNDTRELVKLQRVFYEEILESLHHIEPIGGVTDLIETLVQHNFVLAVASSSTHAQINYFLDKFNFQSYFAVKVSGQDVEKGKPNPDIFLKVAELLNHHPDKCIVIEDSSNGVEAALKAGMKCVRFRNPNSGNQDLSKANLIVNRFANDTFFS